MRHLRFIALFCLLLAPVAASCQSFPGVGNGSGGGTAGNVTVGNGGSCFPLIGSNGIGNGSANPYPSFYTNLVGDTGVITHSGFQGNSLNGGPIANSMVTKAIFADPCNSPNIIVAMDQACNNNAGASNCASVPTGASCTATVFCTEPSIMIFNAATNTLVAGPTLVATDANRNASADCHDCSSAVLGISPGGVVATYGAVTIGGNTAPAAWAAFASGGGASGGTPCTNCAAQPAVYGQNLNASPDSQSFLTAANHGFLPAEGISELSCGQTSWLPGAFVVCSGQTQKNTSWNVEVGVQAMLLGHITCTGAFNCVQFDTQCGEQTPTTATTALCNGAYELTQKAFMDVWYLFSVNTITNTAGQTLTFNPSGAAACGSSLTVTTTGTTGTQAAIDIANAYNSDSTHSCPNTRFKIIANVTQASWAAQCTAQSNACDAVVDENGSPLTDSSSIAAVTCTPGTATTFTCTTSGYKGNLTLNGDYSFGTVRAAPQLCNNCFVQLGSVELDTSTVPSNSYSSNYDNAFYAFLIQPNSSGHGFKYCSIDGYNCIAADITSLNNTPQTVFALLGAGGVGTVATQTNCTGACASGTADVLENMPANWCSNSVAPIGTSQGVTNCLVGTAGGPGSADPFIIRCPTSTTGTNLPVCGTNPPFQFSWTDGAQIAAEAAHGGMATSGRDLGFDGLGLGSASVHITYYGNSTGGTAGAGNGTINDLRISTLNRQVTLNQIAQTTSTTIPQNAGVSISNATGPSGTMYVTWGTGDGGIMNWPNANCSTATGTCLARCTSTNYTSFGNCVKLMQRSPGGNVAGVRNVIYDMPDGFAVLDLYAVMTNTTCTLGTNCDYGLYLHGIP